MISKKQALNIEIVLLKQRKTKTQFAKEMGFTRQTLDKIMKNEVNSPEKEEKLKTWLVENM